MIDANLKALMRQTRLIVFDFDGVFTDNTVYVSENGTESVRCWRGDGIGLRELEKLGIQVLILSTEKNPIVSIRSQKLEVQCIQDCQDKAVALRKVAKEMDIPLQAVAYLGNDINDAACLKIVGLPILVRDSHPDVLPLALIATTKPGGKGAVREVCDWFRNAFSKQERSQ